LALIGQFEQAFNANGFFFEHRYDGVATRMTAGNGLDLDQFVAGAPT
jgi:hypothetical protein